MARFLDVTGSGSVVQSVGIGSTTKQLVGGKVAPINLNGLDSCVKTLLILAPLWLKELEIRHFEKHDLDSIIYHTKVPNFNGHTAH
jgi:hypothetical protein